MYIDPLEIRQNTMRTIPTAIIAGVIFLIAIYGIFTYRGVQEKALRNAAVDGCATAARSIAPNDFVRFIYWQCMVDKGYDTDLK